MKAGAIGAYEILATGDQVQLLVDGIYRDIKSDYFTEQQYAILESIADDVPHSEIARSFDLTPKEYIQRCRCIASKIRREHRAPPE